MNNKQMAENFLNLAKEARGESTIKFEENIKIATVHALLAIAETIPNSGLEDMTGIDWHA